MSVSPRVQEIEYPESDGKPMGETDLHRDWMFRIIELLRYRYRGQQVYVSGDLLVYYEQGNPRKFVVPDAFVVKRCDPGQRRVFKTWEEGRTPDVVLETTSRSTKREDMVFKPQVYQRLGVKEFFLYDPSGEYLKPPLHGFRLQPDGYVAIQPDASGALPSRQLDLLLRLQEGQLVMYDAQTGRVLQTEAEAERAAHELERAAHEADRAALDAQRVAYEAQQAALEAQRAAYEAERAAHEAERAAREAAEAKAAEEGRARRVIEAELQRLRRQVDEERGGEPS